MTMVTSRKIRNEQYELNILDEIETALLYASVYGKDVANTSECLGRLKALQALTEYNCLKVACDAIIEKLEVEDE